MLLGTQGFLSCWRTGNPPLTMVAPGVPLGVPGPWRVISGHCCLCRGHQSVRLRVGASCPVLVAGLPSAVQSLAQTAGHGERGTGGCPPQSFCEPQLVRNPRVTSHFPPEPLGLGHACSQRAGLGWTLPEQGRGWPSCPVGTQDGYDVARSQRASNARMRT